MARYSYSSATTGVTNRIRELVQLVKMSRRPTESSVGWVLRLANNMQKSVYESAGIRLEGLKGLEIGPGQQAGCLRYFSIMNDVVGIDTDVIAHGPDLGAYLWMARHNTFMRTLKTMGRKAIGVDARFSAALARALGVPKLPRPRVLHMSATQMSFEDRWFDFVYTHSVFEHIDDPEAALKEIIRVLRPGGVSYVSLHLYTCHSGSHDPKILGEGTPKPPLWPHLRPDLAPSVRPNTYLNRLSLEQWRALFERVMPGVRFVYDRQDEEIGDGLKVLREAGELQQYTDEELMTVNLIAIWQKPVELTTAPVESEPGARAVEAERPGAGVAKAASPGKRQGAALH